MEAFFNRLAGPVELGEDFRTMLGKIFHERTFERNKYLAKPGEIDRKIFYIKEGIVPSYKIRMRQAQEEKFNAGFYFGGDLIEPLHSYLINTALDYYLQVVETMN